MLKPYWFLEGSLDVESKYYILMGYLVKLKDSFSRPGFEKSFKDLLTLKRDLVSFLNNNEISQRSLSNMTEGEKQELYSLVEKNSDDIEYVKEIVTNSIQSINNFLDENIKSYEKYNSLVEVESYSTTKHDLWDQGFLIIRKNDEEFLRIFNWFFSIIKIGEKDNIALLMTEILDPMCPMTDKITDIKKFLKVNINNFSDLYDCILVGNICNGADLETGIEIGKEKSIEIIMNKFTHSSNHSNDFISD